MVEDDLIDDYLDGSLSEQESEKFEQHFLATTERREKLRFAKALRRYVADARDREKL
jgi:anti-sigma factor RsiW